MVSSGQEISSANRGHRAAARPCAYEAGEHERVHYAKGVVLGEDGWKRTYAYTRGDAECGAADADREGRTVDGVVVLFDDDLAAWGLCLWCCGGRRCLRCGSAEGRRRRVAVYVWVVSYVDVPGVTEGGTSRH